MPEFAAPMLIPESYGPAVAGLLARAPVAPLDAGPPPSAEQAAQLRDLDEAAFFAGRPVIHTEAAQACKAALLLRFGLLTDAHAIVQEQDAAFSAYWHAILHRREADYPNARYWFRRVGAHPIDAPLAARAVTLARARKGLGPAAWMADASHWSAIAFVDSIEAALRGEVEPDLTVCREVQQVEWELLFEACYRHAIGGEVA